MKQLATYTNIFIRFFTAKKTARLQNIGQQQYQLAVVAMENEINKTTTIGETAKVIPKKAPTEWDIAFMQEQYRYYRYTQVVGRRTRVV
jgi:hypothetical protein